MSTDFTPTEKQIAMSEAEYGVGCLKTLERISGCPQATGQMVLKDLSHYSYL